MKRTRLGKNSLSTLILNYFGNECVYCKSKELLNIHHIIPLERGGENSLGNIEIVCRNCHSKIHSAWNRFIPLKRKMVRLECCRCNKINFTKAKSHKNKRYLCKYCKYMTLKRPIS